MSSSDLPEDHDALASELQQLFQQGFDVPRILCAFIDDTRALLSIVDESGHVVFASKQHTQLAGLAADRSELISANDLFPRFIERRFNSPWHRLALDDELSEWELSAPDRQGHIHVYQVRHHLIQKQGDEQRYLLTVGTEVSNDIPTDESRLQAQKQQLHYLGFYDPITGLANRSLFYDRFQKSLAQAKRSENNLVLLLLDLNRARLGSDEFAIALENIVQAEDIDITIEKIQAGLAKPLLIDGHELQCTASVGVSIFPKDGDTIDQLLKCADGAMSKAKAEGKTDAQFYFKSDQQESINYLLIENDLKRAIETDELALHYQPQIDFSQGINLGKVAVNLSPRQFRQESFDKIVAQTISDCKLEPHLLEFELTESSAMENAGETIQLLHDLTARGFSIAIDDFGTGYSSLAYLKRFPINKLKIDRSFVKDVDADEVDAAIAQSIIGLAHNMGLQVIAEGVERISQAEWLLGRGCDQVQGYYYAKPMSDVDLMAFIYDEGMAKVYKDFVQVFT